MPVQRWDLQKASLAPLNGGNGVPGGEKAGDKALISAELRGPAFSPGIKENGTLRDGDKSDGHFVYSLGPETMAAILREAALCCVLMSDRIPRKLKELAQSWGRG